MKCYNHTEKDAIGICKACGKALCQECAEFEHHALICKDDESCKERARINRIVYHNNKVRYSKMAKAILVLLALAILVPTVAFMVMNFTVKAVNWIFWAGVVLGFVGLLMLGQAIRVKTK